MRVIPAVAQHLLCTRADRCPPNLQQGYGHPRRAGAPEETADADETGSGMEYVYRVVWGMLYADDACMVSRSSQGLVTMIEAIL